MSYKATRKAGELEVAPHDSTTLGRTYSHINLITEVIAAKKTMVPDCFYCANPCGRTNSYDMDALKDEPELIQKSKKDILEKLRTCHESTSERSLYRGLISVGLDGATTDFLIGIAVEIH